MESLCIQLSIDPYDTHYYNIIITYYYNLK